MGDGDDTNARRASTLLGEAEVGFYEKYVFNPMLEESLDKPVVHDERRIVLGRAAGEILEIGIGTGLNVPHYPPSVAKITALGPDPELDHRARDRAASRGMTIDYVSGDARSLPFDASRFETVVATLVLCTIPEPSRAVAEMHRVLKPGGALLFFEHVVRPKGFIRTFQHALDPINRVLGCGCSLVRDTRSTIERAGFSKLEVEERASPAFPFHIAWTIRGLARR
jgi:ubiquinone/menaquinone biosynthesis C-methylase UbiE